MKNFEKYEKEILALCDSNNCFAYANGNVCDCGFTKCENCIFSDKNNSDNKDCDTRKMIWLYKEYKEPIKLSCLEFELLKYYQKNDYKYITRDETNSRLSFFKGKPKKSFRSWLSNETFEVRYPVFEKYLTELFVFIKWEDEEPTLIQDILDNCEVIQDE